MRARNFRTCAALASACAFSACTTADIDETDHGSFFVDARVRKDLDGTLDHAGPFAEAGWTLLDGSTGPLEYTIQTVNLGAGVEFLAAEQLWVGFGGGFMGRFNELDTTAGTLDEENGYGVFIALEAGWHATPWLEPYARLYTDGALNEFSTLEQFEAGARFHFIEHTALFVGWRYAAYTYDDIDSALNISEVELDASGVVVGLSVSL
jgi:hypothetical protein